MTAARSKTAPRLVPSPSNLPVPAKDLSSLLSRLGDGNKLVKAISDKKILPTLASTLSSCAALDHQSDEIGPSLGEFCARVLALPLDTQQTITSLLSEQLAIPAPSYSHEGRGRPTTGRDQLASVIYHAFPEDLLKNGKDSKAGKRITDHVRRFHMREGTSSTVKTGGTSKPPTYGRYRKLFQDLYAHCTREEGILLLRLFQRMGVGLSTLDKWSGKHLLENVINVTPESSSSGEEHKAG